MAFSKLYSFSTASEKSLKSLTSIFLIGMAQIIIWGGSYFLLAVLARPIMAEMQWSRQIVYGALSVSIFVSALLLPLIGHLIAQYSGKPILSMSGIVVAVGLLILAFSHTIALFYIAWIIIGIGMALGLYDTLFAVLGDYYGHQAKSTITGVTIISGFTTTIAWPLLAYCVTHLGWRETCLLWAMLMVISIWPLYHYSLPKHRESDVIDKKVPVAINKTHAVSLKKNIYWLMSTIFVTTSVIATVIAVQLIDILQEDGFTLAAAITIGAFIGPSQVVSRALDIFVKFTHPMTSLFISVIFVAMGLILLVVYPKIAVLSIIIYGAGNGLRSIVKATLPLFLVKKEEYAILMGKLARPSLIAQALTPIVSGYFIDVFSTQTVLYGVVGLSILNIVFAIWLSTLIKQNT